MVSTSLHGRHAELHRTDRLGTGQYAHHEVPTGRWPEPPLRARGASHVMERHSIDCMQQSEARESMNLHRRSMRILFRVWWLLDW